MIEVDQARPQGHRLQDRRGGGGVGPSAVSSRAMAFSQVRMDQSRRRERGKVGGSIDLDRDEYQSPTERGAGVCQLQSVCPTALARRRFLHSKQQSSGKVRAESGWSGDQSKLRLFMHLCGVRLEHMCLCCAAPIPFFGARSVGGAR